MIDLVIRWYEKDPLLFILVVTIAAAVAILAADPPPSNPTDPSGGDVVG